MMDVLYVFYFAQILNGMVNGDPESNISHKTVSVSESGAPVRERLTVVSGIDFSHANKSAERMKRQTPTNKHFTDEDKIILLKKHNEFRRLQKSSDMALMYWNDDVEKYAQDWVNGCKSGHSSGRNKTITGFHGAGENLWAGSGGYKAESVVKSWYSEVNNYDYDNKKCQDGKVCGHYTQVVWAASKYLGCALNKCPGMYLVACNYVPWGNYAGARPFRRGDACTECKTGNEYCSVGLCSPIPSIIGGSSQIFSSSVAALTLALQFSVTSQAVFS